MPHRYNLQATGQDPRSLEGRSRKSGECAMIVTTACWENSLEGSICLPKLYKYDIHIYSTCSQLKAWCAMLVQHSQLNRSGYQNMNQRKRHQLQNLTPVAIQNRRERPVVCNNSDKKILNCFSSITNESISCQSGVQMNSFIP